MIDEGKYNRIDGYTRHPGVAVPGVGPILGVTVCGGHVIALRSDGEVPRSWAAADNGWTRITPAGEPTP